MNLFMLNNGGFVNLDCISYIPTITEPTSRVYLNHGSDDNHWEIETDDVIAIVEELGKQEPSTRREACE